MRMGGRAELSTVYLQLNACRTQLVYWILSEQSGLSRRTIGRSQYYTVEA